MKKTSDTSYSLEYSHYNFPLNFPVLGLTGDSWPLPDDEITFLHCHNCLEIGYCHKGTGTFIIESKTVPFTDGAISVVCPNTMHISKSTKGSTGNWEYVYIDVPRLFQEYVSVPFTKYSIFSFDYPGFPNIISGPEHPELQDLLLKILKALRNKSEDYQPYTASLCVAFLIELSRMIPKETVSGADLGKTRLAIYPAIEYINQHYMEPIRIETLAEQCCLSLTHFRRLFKSIMQMSPLDYLNHIRVRMACEMLYNSEESVLDIALAVGFSDNISLNRNFSKIIGTSPLKWKKQTRYVKKNDLVVSIFPT